MSESYYPLWADQVYSVNVSLADLADSSVTAAFTPTNIILTNSTAGSYIDISSDTINFSTSTTQMSLTATELISTNAFSLNISGVLDISAGSITLNGTAAPATSGQALIANDAQNGGLKWFSITDLLNLEAGVYTNTNSSTGASITFSDPYESPPAVVVTPDCGENGRIIPVSLAGVTTTGFSVVFGSNRLDKFNFVVLPVNSSYSLNTSGANFSSSELNTSSANETT
jgi:hypothetical protein